MSGGSEAREVVVWQFVARSFHVSITDQRDLSTAWHLYSFVCTCCTLCRPVLTHAVHTYTRILDELARLD